MYKKSSTAHTLEGFPAAAIALLRALDSSRHRSAKLSGVTGSELRALSRVAELGVITPKDLADSMEMTTGAVTAISSRLVDADLLRRKSHPSDRRSLLLELTPHGNDVMEELYRDFELVFSAATRGVNERDLRTCTALLLDVAERFSTIAAAPVTAAPVEAEGR